MRRVILELRGRVQGVGFRYRVLQIAARFPVSGTVRNLRSGALEIDAEGEEEALEGFLDAVLANPPRSARIDETLRRDAEPRYVTGFGVS
jgi:acylphosphatase